MENELEKSFKKIEECRLAGFVVQIDNGLDNTWEVSFYKPNSEDHEKSYGTSDSFLSAVMEAFETIPY